MRLRSLEIQGFKSFPDKTKLTFDNGITAVVGPNGSGKSNIADAARWVLGEQSTKTLRGAKMEDIIFGGTQTRKALGSAVVSLTIDNTDNAFPMEEDTITITRKLYRSGDSEYLLNGTMVRLRDVHELLMDTGLGRDGYSIIGQGRIAEIVSAKSRERREIFEEAAGIAKYRYRKEEAEKRLDKAEENLLRLRDIVLELEERVGPLKIQAEKARTFIVLSEQKKELEISLWMVSLDQLKEQLSAQENKIYICKNDYEQLEHRSNELEQALNEIYMRSRELSTMADEKRQNIRTLEESLAGSQSQSAVFQNDIHHNELSIKRIEQELDSAGLSTQDLHNMHEKLSLQLQSDTQSQTVMEQKLLAIHERLLEQKEQSSRVEYEILSLNTKQESIVESLQQEKIEQTKGVVLLEESAVRMQAIEQNSSSYHNTVKELEQNILECKTQTQTQEQLIQTLVNTQKGYTLKSQSKTRKLEEVKQKARELLTQREQKLQRAKLLQDLEASMEGFAGSVKYILAQVQKGAVSGVYGAVSSLISTKSEYTTAIETALGAAMQNLVVKDEGVAKECIRLLKNAGAGRATFLPLTSVKGNRINAGEMASYSGFVGIAEQLVQYDDRFSGVIQQLLGRVVVVQDLDSGTQIAKANGYRVRIVTLDGQVISAGGAFTGGSTGKSTGVLGRRHEIESLQEQSEQLKSQIAELEPEIKDLEQEISGIDAFILGASSEEKTANEELVRLGFYLIQLETSLKQTHEHSLQSQNEIAQLSEKIRALRGGETNSAQVQEELQLQLAKIKTELEKATARKETLQVGTQTLTDTMNDTNMAKLSAEKDNELLRSEILRLSQQMQSHGEKSEQLQSQIQELLQTNIVIEEQIATLQRGKENLAQDVEKINLEITSLISQRTTLEGETTKLRSSEREVSVERENISKEMARLEERRITLQSDYDSIISKLWDEYELTRSKALTVAVKILDSAKASAQLVQIKSKIKAIGTVNVDAVEEYALLSERYEFLSSQVKDVEQSKDQLTKLIHQLTGEMRDLFSVNFAKIAANFSVIFTELFGGGKGELTLSEPNNVLESGVDIYVQPPGKVIKNLTLLSGGEQSFVAIAIYFSILKVRPAPFCILDEIEAALDDVNVLKFARYLRTMCDNIQFIAITHRRGTMEEADMLYGVTMQDEGVSKLLELKVAEVESKLGL